MVLHGLDGRRGRDFHEGAEVGERCTASMDLIAGTAAYPLLHRTNEVGEVSGRCISEAGGERPLPRPGNLREKRQLSLPGTNKS